MSNSGATRFNLKLCLYALLLALMLSLLAGNALAGAHSRYLADDYCYDAEFMKNGFFQGQVDSYVNRMSYSSNRYSLTFFSSVFWALGGVHIMPLLPGLAILLWALALYSALREGSRAAGWDVSRLAVAASAFFLLFFILLLAPNRYQILFWRSGLLPYLAPLVANTFLAAYIFRRVRLQHTGAVGVLALGLLAFVAAGFSETIFALQTGFWGLALLIALLKRNRTARNASIAILIGTALGAALLVLCPTNADRQSAFPAPPSLWAIIPTALQYARDFTITFLKGAPLPALAVLAGGLLFGWLEFPTQRFHWRPAFIYLAGLILATAALLVCIMAPTIWSMSAYPELRGLLSGDTLILLCLFGIGLWLGAASAHLLKTTPSRLRLAARILLTLALCAYCARFIQPTYALVDEYRLRAQTWDARDAEIRAAAATGDDSLTIPALDSIAGIFELQPNPGHWVNQCAAQYYGLAEIRSSE